MSYKYTDEKIPKRSNQAGRSNRPSSGGPRSKWDFVTVDELLYGRSQKQYYSDDLGLNETFSELLDMITDYQVNDQNRAEAFHKQARFMESYEASPSDIENAREHSTAFGYHVYIGYQEMDLRELQDYFTWRTLIRQNKDVTYVKGFAVLYAAELITLYSEKDPEGTFEKLLKLQAIVHKQLDEHRRRSFFADRTEETTLAGIIRDYVICWGPAPEIMAEYCVENPLIEEENIILSHIEGADDLSISRLIRSYAETRVQNSRFFEEAGEDAWRVTARVVRRICEIQKSTGHKSLAEKILGKQTTYPYSLYSHFPCVAKQEEGYRVEVTPVSAYFYQGGSWYKQHYYSLRDESALRELNNLIRECERVLRKKMHYKNQLPNRMKDPKTEQLIQEEFDRWMKEKQLRNRPEIRVDLSKLASIRNQADVTRDRLLEGIPENEDILLENAMNLAMYAAGEEAEKVETEKTEAENTEIEKTESGKTEIEKTEAEKAEARKTETEKTEAKKDGVEKAEIEKIERRASGTEIQRYGAPRDDFKGLGGSILQEEAQNSENSIAQGIQNSGNLTKQEEVQNPGNTTTQEASGIFNKKQSTFLQLLLDGGDATNYLKELKVMPSVFVDAINEAAFDEIGDSIVEEDGKSWCLVEDYIEDVRAML